MSAINPTDRIAAANAGIDQGCLILKYFKNPYRCKSVQICKVMSQ
jgi:hypothetical protein